MDWIWGLLRMLEKLLSRNYVSIYSNQILLLQNMWKLYIHVPFVQLFIWYNLVDMILIWYIESLICIICKYTKYGTYVFHISCKLLHNTQIIINHVFRRSCWLFGHTLGLGAPKYGRNLRVCYEDLPKLAAKAACFLRALRYLPQCRRKHLAVATPQQNE